MCHRLKGVREFFPLPRHFSPGRWVFKRARTLYLAMTGLYRHQGTVFGTKRPDDFAGFMYGLRIVPSLRDSIINLSLPGTPVPGYRLYRPCGTEFFGNEVLTRALSP